MERLGFACTVLASLGLAAGPAWPDVFAVAKPETQTVAINGTAPHGRAKNSIMSPILPKQGESDASPTSDSMLLAGRCRNGGDMQRER